jgi:MoaA/NifB/PqqE/SkfB family radical SAM enzyme/ubiquinone/menaquinone biosynthesis C-methylase UbiE
MNTNQQFLNDFMKRVDMRFFTPALYEYLLDFFEIEKVRKFGEQYVISTFIPPFPGKAFDRFMTTYFAPAGRTSIQSVDLALSNACIFNCWHCYNAGRVVSDLPTESLQRVVSRLQDLGAIVINFTGGEPCLRKDLIEIVSQLRDDACGILATTGYGFGDDLARRLRDTRVYSISISLDSADESEHDTRRGRLGAFQIALRAIEIAKRNGFYTYTCAVPTRRLLEPENFARLVELNHTLGVDELQLIEPAPAGRIINTDIGFGEEEFGRVFRLMAEYNSRDIGIAISSFAHMESPEFFGCGAGHSHIYVDGSGEVSPCNMMPISYGNVLEDDLSTIIQRMQNDIKHPYCNCLAHQLRGFFAECSKHCRPARYDTVPPLPLPDEEPPRFFKIMERNDLQAAGKDEIVKGYTDASRTYEDYWLTVAAAPIDDMFARLAVPPGAVAVDCGCGTGYSTAKLAQMAGPTGKVISIDLTAGMIAKAKERLATLGLKNVEFRVGDVLEKLRQIPSGSVDVAVMTWLIGYVACDDIFPLVRRILKPHGSIAFVAHLDRSLKIPLDVFEEITRENPSVLVKAVRMKFPLDAAETAEHLRHADFDSQFLRESTFDYVCHTGQEVYDHVMKSGAGTTFYYSLQPSARARLAAGFVSSIDRRFRGQSEIRIEHRYVVGVGAVTAKKLLGQAVDTA